MRRRADGRWEARRTIGPRGASIQISAYGRTRKIAVGALDEKVAEHYRRQRLTDLSDSGAWTVADLMSWYLDEELVERVADGTMAATTRRGYQDKARGYILPHLGAMPLVDLTPAHVRRWLSQLRRTGASDRTRQYSRAVLVAALNAAWSYELVDGNPAARVPAPTVRRRRGEEVTLAQARALLDAAEQTRSRFQALYLLALHVPLRAGEPLGAEWSALDLDQGLYDVRANLARLDGRWRLHDTKSHRARTVPLPARVVDALVTHAAQQAAERAERDWTPVLAWVVEEGRERPVDLVWRSARGNPIWQSELADDLTRVCEIAEIPRLTPHRLRHAATTLLLAAGVSPSVVQQLAGHSTAAMTDRYTGSMQQAARAGVEALASRLARLG